MLSKKELKQEIANVEALIKRAEENLVKTQKAIEANNIVLEAFKNELRGHKT